MEEIKKDEETKIDVQPKQEEINIEVNDIEDQETTEKDIVDIISYIKSWDYEKYERDHEIREALQLLKNKMIKDEHEKEKQMEKLKQEEVTNEAENNENKNNDIINENANNAINIKENNNMVNDNKIIKNEISEKEKIELEKNWNSSIKPETGEKIINEKGEKEIIRTETIKKEKVIFFII